MVMSNRFLLLRADKKRTDRVRCEKFPVTAYGVGFVSDVQAGVGKNVRKRVFFLPVDVFADFYLRRAAVKKNLLSVLLQIAVEKGPEKIAADHGFNVVDVFERRKAQNRRRADFVFGHGGQRGVDMACVGGDDNQFRFFLYPERSVELVAAEFEAAVFLEADAVGGKAEVVFFARR